MPPTVEHRSRRPELALAGITFLWGSTFIVTKDIVRGAPPLGYVSIRFGAAALLLALLFRRRLVAAPRALYRDGLLLGLGQGAGLLLQVIGQLYTTASKSAFVTAFATALTPLLGLALYRERPTRSQALGVLLASLGLWLLTYPTGDAHWNRGDLLSAGCAGIYAWVIVETSRRARGADPAALTTVQTATAALFFFTGWAICQIAIGLYPGPSLPAIFLIEARPFVWSGKLALQLTYMSLVCTVGTFLGQTWAMSRLSATHAAVVFALEPVFATGLAVAVEGSTEWPGGRGATGAGLVLCGLVASEIKRRSDDRLA